MKKLQTKSKKQPKKSSKSQQVIDKFIKAVKTEHIDYFETDFTISDCCHDMAEHDVEVVSKMSEVAVMNAIKKNKAMSDAINKMFVRMAKEIVSESSSHYDNILEDRRIEEEERKQEEEYEAECREVEEIEREEQKKLNAQKLILKESLSASDRKKINKLAGRDIFR